MTASSRRVPIEAGFFTIPEDAAESPRLLGSRCRGCGEHYYPRRVSCARCYSDSLEDVLLGPRGSLYTYAFRKLPLSEETQRKVVGDNWSRLYGIPSRASAEPSEWLAAVGASP